MKTKLGFPENTVITIGHCFFLLFLLLAVFLFRERVFGADAAFQLFEIIRHADFEIASNRYSLMPSQFLPVAAIWLELPLNAVLILYSVSAPLICYAFYCCAANIFKDYKAAISIALALCIMLTQAFYFATFEISQAVCLLILLFSFINRRQDYKPFQWLIFTIGLAAALYMHPLVFVGFLYLIGFEYIRKHAWKDKKLVLILVLGIAVFLIKVFFLASAYESSKFSITALLPLLPDLFSLEVTSNFGRWLFLDYYWLLIFSIFITFTYIKRRRWLLLGWYWVSLIGFLVLLLLAHPFGNTGIRYYLELHYQLLAMIAVIPMVYDVLPEWQNKRILPLIIGIVLATRLLTIYSHRTVFTNRLAWYDKIYEYTEQFKETRFFVKKGNLPDLVNQNEITWASAFESVMYYNSTGRKQLKTIVIADFPEQFSEHANKGDWFISIFVSVPDAELPKRYFPLEPSVYRFLNSEAPTENRPELQHIKIEALEHVIKGKTNGGLIRIPLKINVPGILIPSVVSRNDSYQLGYRLFSGKSVVALNTILTPMEIDVTGSYIQNLLIAAPSKPGKYYIEPLLLPHTLSSWDKGRLIELIIE